MSNYPVWWDKTLTIFNKFQDPQTQIVTWYRTVVKNCFWKYTGNKVTIDKVVLETNDIICRIPKDSRFLEKHKWIAIPNDSMHKYFTLSPGDIIVRDEISDNINEYVSGHRSSDLLKKYKGLQGCMEIKEWANDTGVGRCSEHYRVKGV